VVMLRFETYQDILAASGGGRAVCGCHLGGSGAAHASLGRNGNTGEVQCEVFWKSLYSFSCFAHLKSNCVMGLLPLHAGCTCNRHVLVLQAFFQSKQSLEKGTVITLLWRPEGVLEILLRESDEGLDYSRVRCAACSVAADVLIIKAAAFSRWLDLERLPAAVLNGRRFSLDLTVGHCIGCLFAEC
jgi:hypothetical protein